MDPIARQRAIADGYDPDLRLTIQHQKTIRLSNFAGTIKRGIEGITEDPKHLEKNPELLPQMIDHVNSITFYDFATDEELCKAIPLTADESRDDLMKQVERLAKFDGYGEIVRSMACEALRRLENLMAWQCVNLDSYPDIAPEDPGEVIDDDYTSYTKKRNPFSDIRKNLEKYSPSDFKDAHDRLFLHLGRNEQNVYGLKKVEGYLKSSANYAQNGIKLGTWWPLRMAVLRDGAHGHSQAGIYGDIKNAAYSIILSAGSSHGPLDIDQGDTIYYSGTVSKDFGSDKSMVTNKGTNMLRKSMELRKVVRVIRGVGSPWGTEAGFRYDGLYQVVDSEVKKYRDIPYVRFKLRRELRQKKSLRDIIQESPTEEEKVAYLKDREVLKEFSKELSRKNK